MTAHGSQKWGLVQGQGGGPQRARQGQAGLTVPSGP